MRSLLITLALALNLTSANIFAQPGAVDLTFNPGDEGFSKGMGIRPTIFSAANFDGRIIVVGHFQKYDNFSRRSVAVLLPNGQLDETFDPGTGANGPCRTVLVQPDGKAIIGGYFTKYNGADRQSIARINNDGTLDASFSPWPSGPNGTVYTTALQPDGKILIGGQFTDYSGTPRKSIARIDTWANLDNSFNPGAGFDGIINKIVVQPDGKIIAVGYYFVGDVPYPRICRFNSNGSLDSTFTTNANHFDKPTISAEFQTDGKLVVTGYFLNFNGVPTYQVARLNTDGTLDTSFSTGIVDTNNVWRSVSIANDGKIVLAGSSNSLQTKIISLNANGTRDSTFAVYHDLPTYDVAYTSFIQPDGKIVLAGEFSTHNGAYKPSIARVHPNGQLDDSFNQVGSGATGSVFHMAVQQDGNLIVSGNFEAYNGESKYCLLRIKPDGMLDTIFKPKRPVFPGSGPVATQGNKIVTGNFEPSKIIRFNTDGSVDSTFKFKGLFYPYNVLVQPDNKILISGQHLIYDSIYKMGVFRLNNDGTLDSSFNFGSGTSDWVLSSALLPNGKILIGGLFTSYNNVALNRIARLNTDGTVDATFSIGAGFNSTNSAVDAFAVLTDGKVIVGGGFESYNGQPVKNLVRLNINGSLDASFNISGSSSNGRIRKILQAGDKLIIIGSFTSYNGIPRNKIARLNSDGSLDLTFDIGTGPDNAVWTGLIDQSGKLVIGGDFTSINGYGRNRIARLLTGASVLPSSSTHLSAKLQDEVVRLNSTINATAWTSFDVERSKDGITFSAIETKQSGANPIGGYQHLDQSPFKGANFYRLAVLNKDGNKTYSNIAVVTVQGEAGALTIFPNPVNNNKVRFFLKTKEKELFTLRVVTTNGQICYESRISCGGDAAIQSVHVPSLPRGSFYILQMNGKEKVHTALFVTE